jgi:hypothetical protein
MTNEWAKSTYCTTAANCTEVRKAETGADVRDSKDTSRGHLSFQSEAWQAFVTGAGKLSTSV